MVITTVDAEVPADAVGSLLEGWAEVTAEQLPPGLRESFLMHAGDAWRIATVWENREVLEEMRRTTETPGALRVFRAAGVEPALTVFEVMGHVAGV